MNKWCFLVRGMVPPPGASSLLMTTSVQVGTLVWVPTPDGSSMSKKAVALSATLRGLGMTSDPSAEPFSVGTVVGISSSGDTIVEIKTEDSRLVSVTIKNGDELMFANDTEEDDGGCDDMTLLNYLHPAALLENIRRRFSSNVIYTYTGKMVVAMNPFKRLSHLYTPQVRTMYGKLENFASAAPHVYAVADKAFSEMMNGHNQSILVSGESGAGKTETVKILMNFLAMASQQQEEPSISGTQNSDIAVKVLGSNPLLEAFGNAKTLRNDNSSRFGKFIEIQFNPKGEVIGAKTHTYLLERSRVVGQTPGERNYHIFYQLCAAIDDSERRELGIRSLSSTSPHQYIKSDALTKFLIDGETDEEMYERTIEAMRVVGITTQEVLWTKCVLASILHLGDVIFGSNSEGMAVVSDPHDATQWVSKLLSINEHALISSLTTRLITTKDATYVKGRTVNEACDTRDALAKALYGALFEWLVDKVNSCCAAPRHHGSGSHPFIGLLDIFGFECFEKNSFEQFCINYANEKLQQQFIKDTFKAVQDEYDEEGIDWSRISFNDNQETLDLIEKRMGILSLLDEECIIPKGSDEGLVSKISTCHKDHTSFSQPVKRNLPTSCKAGAFTVKHYAGDVTYMCDGFLDKNRDSLHQDVVAVLAASTDGNVVDVFANPEHPASEAAITPTKLGKPKKSTKVTQTVGATFKFSLNALMSKLSQTAIQYIRCVKPNTLCQAAPCFEATFVANQLRYSGVLDVIRISRSAYPNKMTHAEFCIRFRCLAPNVEWGVRLDKIIMDAGILADTNNINTVVKMAAETVQALGKLSSEVAQLVLSTDGMFQSGRTRIYFQPGCLEQLEDRRRVILSIVVTKIQKVVRGYVHRLWFLRARRSAVAIQAIWRQYHQRSIYRKQQAAAITLHKTARGFLARRYTKHTRITNAVIKIQSWIRGRKVYKTYYQTRRLCIRVQAWWRMFSVHRLYILKRDKAREDAKLENQLSVLMARLKEEVQAKEALEKENCQLRLAAAALSSDSYNENNENEEDECDRSVLTEAFFVVSGIEQQLSSPEPPHRTLSDPAAITDASIMLERLQRELNEERMRCVEEREGRLRAEHRVHEIQAIADQWQVRFQMEANERQSAVKQVRHLRNEVSERVKSHKNEQSRAEASDAVAAEALGRLNPLMESVANLTDHIEVLRSEILFRDEGLAANLIVRRQLEQLVRSLNKQLAGAKKLHNNMNPENNKENSQRMNLSISDSVPHEEDPNLMAAIALVKKFDSGVALSRRSPQPVEMNAAWQPPRPLSPTKNIGNISNEPMSGKKILANASARAGHAVKNLGSYLTGPGASPFKRPNETYVNSPQRRRKRTSLGNSVIAMEGGDVHQQNVAAKPKSIGKILKFFGLGRLVSTGN